MYDGATARFFNVDPKTTDYYFQSPYVYAANNPIRFIDWMGMAPSDPLMRMKIRDNRASNLMGGTARTYGTRPHQGFDYYATEGTDTYAVGSGRVVRVNNSDNGRGYGRYLVLETTNESGEVVYAFYGHMESIAVDQGTLVADGDMVGTTGVSGNASSDAPHLHFELWAKNPLGCSMSNRISPNQVTDTDFVSQNDSGNQTFVGVSKITKDSEGITITNQNLNGTEQVVRQPIPVMKLLELIIKPVSN